MKRLIFALCFLALVPTANASYETSVDKQRLCKISGGIAEGAWEIASFGDYLTAKAFMAGVLPPAGSPEIKMYTAIGWEVYSTKGTRRNAYMKGWARCMDTPYVYKGK